MKSFNPLEVIDKYASVTPVPVFQILHEAGLGPEFRSLDENISGWIERCQDSSYRVVVNAGHALVRQRFTAAHELGHYIYHLELLGSGVGDTRAYRADSTPFPNAQIMPMHERQANSFAANLLMPRTVIADLKAAGVTAPEDLAERFEVSLHAMCIRLGVPY